MRVILASASPRRDELLRQIGIHAEVDPADIDESAHAGETPDGYVERIARAKVAAVGVRHPFDAVIIGADTAVVVAGEMLGKPIDHDDAARMLRSLSGRSHVVHTGVAVSRGGRTESVVARTTVRFVELSEQTIDAYITGGEPLDKAGSYALQGAASMFVDGVDGPVDNVIGLPRRLTSELLARIGSPVEVLRSHSTP